MIHLHKKNAAQHTGSVQAKKTKQQQQQQYLCECLDWSMKILNN
jgi:hypothetical protein